MNQFHIILTISTFLCSMVAGFLFAYAVVVMPGIKKLNDSAFIRAFQVTDGIIQNSQPLFILMWLGSIIALLVSAIYGFGRLVGVDFYLLASATIMYLGGVQILTVVINLPLNNQLQKLNVDSMNDKALQAARTAFESKWNTSNVIRTAVASCVSVLLITLLVRI